jgi:hypothetical protein
MVQRMYRGRDKVEHRIKVTFRKPGVLDHLMRTGHFSRSRPDIVGRCVSFVWRAMSWISYRPERRRALIRNEAQLSSHINES